MSQSITLKGIERTKRNGKIDLPFFVSGNIYVTLESYQDKTSKVIVEGCTVNLVKGKNEAESQLNVDEELKELFKQIPVLPNTLIVKNANIHFIENFRKPHIDLCVKDIHIEGKNIANQRKSKEKYPSTFTVAGDFEGAKLKAIARVNKQEKDPMVHLVSSLSPLQIARVKSLLKVYADLDVDSGTLSATSTINIYNGRMDGYIDPVAKELVFHQSFDKKVVKLGKRLKHRLLNDVSKLLGREEKKIETRIELHGTLGEVQVDVWEIIHDGLKKSFNAGLKKKDEKND